MSTCFSLGGNFQNLGAKSKMFEELAKYINNKQIMYNHVSTSLLESQQEVLEYGIFCTSSWSVSDLLC